MMRRTIRLFPLIFAAALFLASCEEPDEEASGRKTAIILDSDMVENFDDGVAFMILLGAENVEVKGLTTVSGNVWAQEALAYGIRIGELCGGRGLTYIAGSQYPLAEGRLDRLDAQIDANPGMEASYRGAVSYDEIKDWRTFYVGRYGKQPEIQPLLQNAPEYIARQVMSAPGQVTILAIGPCTNVAKAIVAHPEMARNAREIIYMGGAVYCPGNTTPYAEMNFIYDPEAAAICLRAPFPRQTIVSLDVCNTVSMSRHRFMEIYDSIDSEPIREMFRRNYTYDAFESDPDDDQLVWDLISAIIAIDPGIITEYKDVRLDVDDVPDSPTYGKVYETTSPLRQTVRVPLKIDQDRFWDSVISHMSRL